MEQGSAIAWPAKEDIETLMAELTLVGRRAFFQEKQNTPLGRSDAVFDPTRLLVARRDDAHWEVMAEGLRGPVAVRRAPHTARRFGYLDAALGKSAAIARGDFAALAAVVLLDDGTLVIDELGARRLSPTAQIEWLFASHEAAPYRRLAIEGTGFQELLLLPLEAERSRRRQEGDRWDLPTEARHPRRNKAARIAGLEPLIQSGRLVLGCDPGEEFREELANWPRCRHDDALDALAGAVEMALEGRADGAGNVGALGGISPARGGRRF